MTAIIAYAFDLPTPLLWGVMAAVLNFVPYAGSAATLTALTLVAILTHDTLGPAFGVALCYLAAATIEGQLVQPLALGRRLALSPLIVFLGLWVWGWIWGVAGLLLATPILLAIKSVSCQTSRWGPVAEFLSPEPGAGDHFTRACLASNPAPAPARAHAGQAFVVRQPSVNRSRRSSRRKEIE